MKDEKTYRKTEENKVSEIGEFKLKGSDTVNKRKRPRAV